MSTKVKRASTIKIDAEIIDAEIIDNKIILIREYAYLIALVTKSTPGLRRVGPIHLKTGSASEDFELNLVTLLCWCYCAKAARFYNPTTRINKRFKYRLHATKRLPKRIAEQLVRQDSYRQG